MAFSTHMEWTHTFSTGFSCSQLLSVALVFHFPPILPSPFQLSLLQIKVHSTCLDTRVLGITSHFLPILPSPLFPYPSFSEDFSVLRLTVHPLLLYLPQGTSCHALVRAESLDLNSDNLPLKWNYMHLVSEKSQCDTVALHCLARSWCASFCHTLVGAEQVSESIHWRQSTTHPSTLQVSVTRHPQCLP